MLSLHEIKVLVQLPPTFWSYNDFEGVQVVGGSTVEELSQDGSEFSHSILRHAVLVELERGLGVPFDAFIDPAVDHFPVNFVQRKPVLGFFIFPFCANGLQKGMAVSFSRPKRCD